jgi:hypothetical protein
VYIFEFQFDTRIAARTSEQTLPAPPGRRKDDKDNNREDDDIHAGVGMKIKMNE